MDKKFNLKYDPEGDILNVAYGTAKEAVSVEVKPEVFARVDPKTKEVVGLTVIGFKQNFLSRRQSLTLDPHLSI